MKKKKIKTIKNVKKKRFNARTFKASIEYGIPD